VHAEIVREARHSGCDLIVMGMSSWSRFFQSKASSTICRVIQEAGVPVFVAPMPRQDEQ
jgi:nucleotide-binding universal stress UspA family protein